MSGALPTRPSLSVVVATTHAGPRLTSWLERVHGPLGHEGVEILASVPERVADEAVRRCAAFARVRVVRVAGVATIPQLYASGLFAAGGECVALSNDRFLPAHDWLAAIERAHAGVRGPTVVAGAVALSPTASVVDRAVYYAEYGSFRPDRTVDAPAGAAGGNVSYNREALTELSRVHEPSRADVDAWEYFWHRALADRGVAFRRDSRVVVTLAHHWTVSAALRERFHYSRAFAAERSRSWNAGWRAAAGAAALTLPVVVMARLLRDHARSGWSFVSALPVIGVLTVAWAFGEATGAWTGPGHSLGRVTLG